MNEEKKIVGVGYNGMPNGCSDDVLPWKKSGDWLDTKYPYGKHDSTTFPHFVPNLATWLCIRDHLEVSH